jgi:hypothetical protein
MHIVEVSYTDIIWLAHHRDEGKRNEYSELVLELQDAGWALVLHTDILLGQTLLGEVPTRVSQVLLDVRTYE